MFRSVNILLSESRIIADYTDFANYGQRSVNGLSHAFRVFGAIGVRNPSYTKNETLNVKNFTHPNSDSILSLWIWI